MTATQTVIYDQPSAVSNTISNSEELRKSIFQNSDFLSFEELFHSNYSKLLALAYYFMKSQVQAEEVVSEVFLKIWRDRKSIRIKTSLNAYLNMAVKNKCLDLLRATKKQTDSDPQPYLDDSISKLTSPLDELVSNELQNKIESAIEKLPNDRKRVFRLSRDNGLKYREIADHLQISIKTVETQMCRALKQLRNELDEYLGYN